MNAPQKEQLSDDVTVWLGDCLQVLPEIGKVDHIICDPPYERIMHEAKTGAARRIRTDGRTEITVLDFAPIDGIRDATAALFARLCWLGDHFLCARGRRTLGGRNQRDAGKIQAGLRLGQTRLNSAVEWSGAGNGGRKFRCGMVWARVRALERGR